MGTQCTPKQLEFHGFGRREVVARFDGGRLTSDGVAILLREVDRRLGLTRRVADCFTDYRDPIKVEHSVLEMVTHHPCAFLEKAHGGRTTHPARAAGNHRHLVFKSHFFAPRLDAISPQDRGCVAPNRPACRRSGGTTASW